MSVALITGASRGIGAATARELAARGFAVAVGYRRDRDAAEAVASGIQALGPRALAVGADVARPDDRLAQDIGLELHQEVVDGGAAIDPQLLDRLAGIGFHGIDQLTALKGDAFESGAHDLRLSAGAR